MKAPFGKTKVALFGAGGRMGAALVEQISKSKNAELIACIDRKAGGLPNLEKQKPDVVIDFSSPDGTIEVSRWCAAHKVPLVSGTTGHSVDQLKKLRTDSVKVAVFMSPNMSPGINGLVVAIEKYLESFTEGEIVIEEVHHTNKKDAPSGTAKYLHQAIEAKVLPAVKISEPISIRGGDVFGIHRVSFFTEGEWVSFEHHATNRIVFARGAVLAAQWLIKQKPGFYGMKDFLKDLQ